MLNYTPVTLGLVEETMRDSRPKFPWSDDQIGKAFKRRALPTVEQQKILWDLAILGAEHILAVRAGGKKRRNSVVRGAIRRHVIQALYSELDPELRKSPTGAETVGTIRDILAEKYNFNYSVETVSKDIKKIGTAALRRK
jgi:hypothetical protein